MILVTGGMGFIGSHVTRALLDSGEHCVITTHSASTVPEFLKADVGTNLFVEPLDMANAQQWHDLGRRHRVTGIVHLASAGIDVDPMAQLRQNLSGLLNLLDVADIWNVDRVVLASTIGVYAGAAQAIAYREDVRLPMVGLHGIQASKKAAEIIGDLANRSRSGAVVSLRLPAVWGPRGNPDSRFFALGRLVHAAVRGEVARAIGGEAIDLLYVKDCARAVASVVASDRLRHTVYNIGSGRATSNVEVVEAIRRVVPTADVAIDLTQPQASSVPASYLDVSRLGGDTDYEPAYALDGGIRDYVDWLRAGHDR